MAEGASRPSPYSNLARFQGSCQLLNSASQFAGVYGGKSQHDAIMPRTAVGIATQRNHFDIVLGGSLGGPLGANSTLQPGHCPQTGFDRRNFQQPRQPFASGLQ